MSYPRELLPRKNISAPELKSNSLFVRTLREFPKDCIDGEDFLPEITDELLKPNGRIEVYSLSLFLYGIFSEKHFGISVTDNNYFEYWDGEEELVDIPFELKDFFALFLKISFLNGTSVEYEGDTYYLHYEHKPTRANFWHYELFVTKNGEPNHVPRKKGATREHVADKIKEDILFFAVQAAKDKFFKLYENIIN